jgi:hypothetical protein
MVLKKLHKRWEKKLRKKKEIFDTYLAYVTALREGFRQIYNATGHNMISEVAETLIKSDEQKRNLKKYISSLNNTIDAIEE